MPKFSLHLCETDDIKALEGMCAMRWITEDHDIIGSGVVKEIKGVMGAVAIHEKNSSLAISFRLSLGIKVFDHPL